ncbi:MAG: flagellar filament capping protein FliD [Pseudomonadota bacterium]|nr:flagellar filament capping protein FliD [Pseudomonadota bacterium]
MATTVGGLVSGIDTGALVDGLVAAAGRTKTIMEAQKDTLDTRKEAYATLSARLTSLQEALEAIDEPDELRSVSARSSDDDSIGVTVDGDAVVGRFEVQVNRLARASMDVSAGFASRDTAGVLATGTLSVTIAGTTTDITVGAGDSLDDLVAAINDQVDGATAYIMDTGDATAPYRLVIGGDETGAENAVTLDTSGLDSGTGQVPSFTTVTAAVDAEVVINGTTVTDPDNEIDAAVQGLHLNLYATTTSAVDVSVARDPDTMVERVQTVVDSWNAVMSQIRSQRTWNPDEDIRGAFVGESEPRAVMQRLQTTLSSTYGTEAMNALGAIGLTTAQNGDLELDEDALREALTTDFEGVVAFATGETGAFASIAGAIDRFTDEDTGTITARGESLDTQIDTLTQRIDDFQDHLDAYRSRLQKQFTAMEIAMSRFQNAGSAIEALLPSSED